MGSITLYLMISNFHSQTPPFIVEGADQGYKEMGGKIGK